MTAVGHGERVTPASIDELRTSLAQWDRDRVAVRVEGGNTLHGMGSTQSRTDVTLSTAALSDLLAHEYHDLTCAVRGGMRLSEMADLLAKYGQFVPIDAPLRRAATAGGTLAAGWLGPRRHFYGRARDFVIGSQVVLADGTLANAGGMVVKNVSGYDMSKLYIGSFGTLGVITQLNFKTLPLPARRRAVMARLPEHTRARVIAQICALNVTPSAAFWIEGFRKQIDGEDGVDGRIFILLEGTAALLDRATLDLRSALGRAGVPEAIVIDTGAIEGFERILDATIASLGERSITYRSLGPADSAPDRAIAQRDAAHRCELYSDVLCDLMNGDVFLRVSEHDSRAFAEKVERCDDELRREQPRSTIVAGDAPIRPSLSAWGSDPPAITTMRALKTRFDPHATLNPGRFVGGI